MLGRASFFMCVFSTLLGLCFQICICVDLILTLKRPFKSKEARMPAYIGFSVFASLIPAIGNQYARENHAMFVGATTYSVVLIALSWVLSLVSIVYGCLKLCKTGISQKVRRQILARHVTTIVFFSVFELYLQVSTVVILLDDTADSIGSYDGPIALTLKIIYGT